MNKSDGRRIIQIEEIINRLKEAGYKLTPQRIAICKLILESKNHPSADWVFKTLKPSFPSISLATVYKTIQLLTELRLIQEVGIDEGKIRIDPNQSLHLNLICTKCGNIIDYITESFSQQWSKIIKELKFTPSGQLINIYYVCEKCNS